MAINVLEPKVYNRIAAGEVVERPASIVKELVENSIDAGATLISIEIENGGISKVQVSDNGCGIEKNDLVVAFKPHATSKIQNVDDLDNIRSLGFRGEALASISSVCHVYLSSKTANSEVGYSINVDGGDFGNVVEVARQNGTTLIVSDLFYNTPVRAKFLRKPKSEEAEVTHLVEKFMLAHPEISFRYYADGKQVYNTTSGSMQDIIYTIYGREVYDSLLPIDHQENGYRLEGFITKPKISKSNRTFQTLFVNKRYVENYLISSAVQGVYENFLMKGKFPVYVLNISVPFDSVDVNVHPSKREVKFENSSWIFGFVRRAVEKTLLASNQIASFGFDNYQTEGQDNNLSSEFNQQGFNPIYKNDLEPLAETEGASYKESVDHTQDLTPLKEVSISSAEKQEYVVKRKPNLSDEFKDLTLPDELIPKNKPGNDFLYFDQPDSGFAYEILNGKKVENASFLTSSIEESMKILGTVFNTYIVVELDQSVFFIDQHAGHERLLYDKLVKDVDKKSVATQDLLVGYNFTLTAQEVVRMERHFKQLEEIGFKIENNGGNNYTVKTIPLVLTGIEMQSFIDEVVKDSISFEKKPSEFIHNRLCQSACKHAIKGGDSISKQQCAYLIENIRKGVMLCPHGRPIVLELTKKELEKMFGRIV